MNLHFSIDTICSVIGADFIEAPEINIPKEINNVVIDTRSPAINEKTLFIALKGQKNHGVEFIEDFVNKGGKIVLTDRRQNGKGFHQLICKDPVKALQQLAKYHREQFNIPVIGITGSNGKTVVKEWLYHVLKGKYAIVRSPKSFNSQIGVPLSVLEITERHQLAIFEAGISMPGEMQSLEATIKPSIGIFTGLGDAHSNNFNSDEVKKQEKFVLFGNCEELISAEQESEENGIPFNDDASRINAALVKKAALYLGMDLSEVSERLKDLPAVSMRMEQIEAKNNSILLNDAYNADLASLEIGLKHLNSIASDKQRIVIMTPLEESDSQIVQVRINELLKSAQPDRVIFIGEQDYIEGDIEYYPSVQEYLKKTQIPENAAILLKGSRKSALEKIVREYAKKKHITTLTINFQALRNNLNYFRSLLEGNQKVLAMVKAQSYGGGLIEVATFLTQEKVDYFGVAYADEGVMLRNAGIKQPIIVMNPEVNAFDEIIDYQLEPSIYSPELLNSFIHQLIVREKSRFPVHIKLDTGMNRLGFIEEDIDELCDTVQVQPEIVVASVFSHLSVADDAEENEFTYGQIRKFEMMSGTIKDKIGYDFERHLANSAGTVNFPRAHFDMVRLGIGLFGLMDVENRALENVLTFTSQISQVKLVKEGESVGYGRSFIADRETKIGVIPVGYADGLRRGLSLGQWSIFINGQKAPIVGSVCMDMCMVNLSGIEAKPGDEVEIFGNNNSIFEMADVLHTIPYEIISGISSRVYRVYIEE